MDNEVPNAAIAYSGMFCLISFDFLHVNKTDFGPKCCDIITVDCQDAFDHGARESGAVYYLKPRSNWRVIKAVCEFDSTSGWTVIQRRLDGSVDFYRYWSDYTSGFGDTGGEYWIGKLVTSDVSQQL